MVDTQSMFMFTRYLNYFITFSSTIFQNTTCFVAIASDGFTELALADTLSINVSSVYIFGMYARQNGRISSC